MLRDFRKNKLFNRRTAILGGAQSVLVSALVARLGYLQIFKYEEYSTKSDSNRIRPLINPAPRGLILDRNGKMLISNSHNYRLLLYMENKPDVNKIIEKISEILMLSDADKEIMLNRVKNARRKSIVSLVDNLSWDDVARIEINYYKLAGVSIGSGVRRRYPFPLDTAHFVGYVSLPSEKDIESNSQNLFLHPDFRIGKSGVEKSFDESLRGKFGVRYVEVNAFGVPVRTLSTQDSIEGSRLNLTVDLRLQQFISERIKDLTAAVTVIDVKTGEIIAMCSSPSFDPNQFVEGVSRDYWKQLIGDPKKPLNNKPISATYPPGSTFKLMVAIAAQELGLSKDEHFYCNGAYQLGRRTFHCWKKEGHGSMDMSNGIKNSCNVYFFNVANRIGIEKITEVAKRFGYGEHLDVSLFGVKSGNVPSDEWKRKVFKQPWVKGDTLNTAIGQGFVLATPLQMAVIAARIANGGVPIKPYLVRNRNIYSQYNDLKAKVLADKKHLDVVREGMYRVVNEVGGTAYGKRITVKGWEMAGKTGTSQVISKREDQMTNEEMNNNQNHAIFIGFAPVSNPKYAVSVAVEHGGAGSATAAPIGHDVLLEAQRLLAGGQ